MPSIHGIVIEIEALEVSQNGNYYTRGIIEDKEHNLHDFVIFWKDKLSVKDIKRFDTLDLVGKKDRTEGTFKANYVRDPNKDRLQREARNAVNTADERYTGSDAINGKRPIDYCMDILGVECVNKEIRTYFGSYSLVMKDAKSRAQYKELLASLISAAKEVERESRF